MGNLSGDYTYTDDPTNGAFQLKAANFDRAAIFTCVGICVFGRPDPNNPNMRQTQQLTQYTGGGPVGYRFDAVIPNGETIQEAYNRHKEIISNYIPDYQSVYQPVLFVQPSGYVWTTQVYQQSDDMRHSPRYNPN